MIMVHDCHGWTTAQLLEFCDGLPTAEARRRFIIAKGRAEVEAGNPGTAHEVVMARARAVIEIWFDKARTRPRPIPRFKTAASEQAFWKTHSVLDYFAETDILEGLA